MVSGSKTYETLIKHGLVKDSNEIDPDKNISESSIAEYIDKLCEQEVNEGLIYLQRSKQTPHKELSPARADGLRSSFKKQPSKRISTGADGFLSSAKK